MTKVLIATIDIYPWPDGMGFRGLEAWWEYVRQQTDSEKLDLLMTMALMSSEIGERLLIHDPDLFKHFKFSALTLERLSAIQATSIEAFAAALIGQTHGQTENGV